MIRLVLCDMDGTLLPFGHQEVSARTLAAIEALRRAGIGFGPASGRELEDVMGFFGKGSVTIENGILANGKYVLAGGEVVYRRELDRYALQKVVDYAASQRDCGLVTHGPARSDGSAERLLLGASAEEAAGMRTSEGGRVDVTLAPELPDCPILTVGFLCSGSTTRFAEVRQELAVAAPELDFVSPAPGFLDVMPRGWNKGTALDLLLEALGLATDEVAFFGDSENDLALMRRLPNSVCVENGSDEAKRTASFHIARDLDDAPARVMEAIARSGGDLAIPDEVSRD